MCFKVGFSETQQNCREANFSLVACTFLAPTFSDRVITFLLQKLEMNNEKTRIASLAIIKHLINSSGETSNLHEC